MVVVTIYTKDDEDPLLRECLITFCCCIFIGFPEALAPFLLCIFKKKKSKAKCHDQW